MNRRPRRVHPHTLVKSMYDLRPYPCAKCGESPDSGIHVLGDCTYVFPGERLNTWTSDLQEEAQAASAATRGLRTGPAAPSWLDTADGLEASGALLPPLVEGTKVGQVGPLRDGPAGFTITGVVRLYFNRRQDAPRVWCISDADRVWELQLAHVTLVGVALRTVYDPEARSADPGSDNRPAAYQVTLGEVVVTVTGDSAMVTGT